MQQEKVKSLDGIRGLMALNVILGHFVLYYYPQMHFLEESAGAIQSLFAATPLSLLINANVAVQYFHVLIGFLTGRKCLVGEGIRRGDLVAKCVSRYFRLMPVVAVTTVCTYLVMRFDLHHNLAILDRVGNPETMGLFCAFPCSIKSMLLEAFYVPFVESAASYVPVFWCIYYELWGYVLSLLACYFLKDFKWRRLAYVLIALLLWSEFIPFFMGCFVADLCYKQDKDTTVLSRFYGPVIYHKALAVPVLVLGILLAACPHEFVGWYAFFGRIPKLTTSMVRAAGCALVIFSLIRHPGWGKRLESRILLFFGRISFCLYAVHVLLMITVQAWLFDWMTSFLTYDGAALGSFLLTLPAIIAAAYAMHCLVEKKIKIDLSFFLQREQANETWNENKGDSV